MDLLKIVVGNFSLQILSWAPSAGTTYQDGSAKSSARS